MKPLSLIKVIPILATLTFILILNNSNKNEFTKLKILIWDTPSVSLGTYVAISASSGYLLSFLLTTYLSRGNYFKKQILLKYKRDIEDDEISIEEKSINKIPYENTWIERDIKDPSPTMNASFRVIGKNNYKYRQVNNDLSNDIESSNYPDESDYQFYENEINNRDINSINISSNDWEDDSYTNW